MIADTHTPRPDAIVLLNKAYNDLVAACTNVAESLWADATDIDRISVAVDEIKYWSLRVQAVVEMNRRPANA